MKLKQTAVGALLGVLSLVALQAPLTGQRRPVASGARSVSVSRDAVAGCVGGRLVDPRAYVQSLIGGSPASDYRNVLTSIDGRLKTYGIWQQRTSGGEVRGRLFEPYAAPGYQPGDPYYEHAVDIVDQSKSPAQWVWVDRGGPSYAAWPCGSEPPPPPPPPPSDLAARVKALETQVDDLRGVEAVMNARLLVLENKPGSTGKIPTGCKVPYLGCALQFTP